LHREIEVLRSSDDAALWAQLRLAAKNALAAADAERVEQAFQKKLATFASATAAQASVPDNAQQRRRVQSRRRQSHQVDKTVLALPAPRRIRDREHIKSVAKQPCLICGRRPADAHHLRFTQSRALGRKVSDEFTIPLCRGHHRAVHHCGDEAAWWEKAGIDPTVSARQLWLKTHPLPPASDHFDLKNANSASAVSSESSKGRRDQPVSGGDQNYRTKPILESGSP